MSGSSDIPNYTGLSSLGMNYQNFDNNNFSNNFMMPSANNELLDTECLLAVLVQGYQTLVKSALHLFLIERESIFSYC